ncbi:MAG: flagellar hook-associated protein FlgK [Alphaproteobacteria bacterium]|nr:flagellar hook-associated protein FlgK [Alphaproteobacteria bacterium]
MSLTSAIRTAVSSLQVTQTRMQIASNNIANVNTPGYTRKSATTSSRVIAGVGEGIQIESVTRTVDQFLIRQLRDQQSTVGQYTIRDRFLGQVQDQFGTPADNVSLSHRIEALAGEIEGLANTPEDAAIRSQVISQAQVLAGLIQSLRSDLQTLRQSADQEILEAVTDINSDLQAIGDLNVQINQARGSSEPTVELEDRRDQLVREIAEKIDIRTFERSNGELVVLTGAARQLVDGGQVNTLSYTPVPGFAGSVSYVSPTSTYNTVNGLYLGAAVAANDITQTIGDGELRGLIDLRDKDLSGLQSQLDQLTSDLRDVVNGAHNNGAAFPPPATLTGSRSFVGGDVVVPAGDTGGTFRIAIVDQSTGAVAAGPLVADIALGAGPLTVTNIITAINGAGLGAIASLNASGQLVLAAPGANQGIVINEGSSAIRMGAGSRGFSHFFGLNDMFTNSTSYATYDSDVQTTTATFTGTLSFQQAGAAVNIAAAGDTVEQIADLINANGALTAAGISATVISDGTGHRLRVVDAQGDHITVFGGLAATLGMNENVVDGSSSFAVSARLIADSNQLSTGGIDAPPAALPAAGDIIIGSADNTGALALSQVFSNTVTIASSGSLPNVTGTLSDYAAQVISLQSSAAATATDEMSFNQSLLDQLDYRNGATSAVNLDEELAQLIELENAYAASSRLITVADEMFQDLLNTLR